MAAVHVCAAFAAGNGTSATGQFKVSGVAQTGGHEIDVSPANVANVVFEVDAMPSTLSLVERGVGYTVLSEGAVKHLLTAGRIRSWSLTNPTLMRELLLATSTQRPMSVATRLVARLIRDEVQVILRGGNQPADRAAAQTKVAPSLRM